MVGKDDHTARRVATSENLDVPTHSEHSSLLRDRRYECTSIVASETLRVSCQENFNAGMLRQNVGKITIIHLKNPRRSKKKREILTFTIAASCDTGWACKNFDERRRPNKEHKQRTAPGAFALKPRENRNFGAIIYLAYVPF